MALVINNNYVTHYGVDEKTAGDIAAILKLLKTMKKEELQQIKDTLTTVSNNVATIVPTVNKISGETTSLLDKISQLEDDGGLVNEIKAQAAGLDAATTGLATAVAQLDLKVDDLPVVEEPGDEGEPQP